MDESNWYYNSNGRPAGPVNLGDLRQLFANGTLHPGTLVWHATLVQWMAASQVPGLLPPGPPIPPPPPLSPLPPFAQTFGTQRQTSYHSLALVGFILSLVGLVPCFGIFLAIPGLILGIIALAGMSHTNNHDGHGLAVAAIVIGALACVCHCGLGFNLIGPPGDWHYEFHRHLMRQWNI